MDNIENDAWQYVVLTNATTDQRLLSKGKNGVYAYLLYHFYATQSAIQRTNQVWVTDYFCRKGLHWGRERMKIAKKILLDEGIIEETPQAVKGKEGFQKKYVKIHFLLENSKETIKHATTETHLREGSTNALDKNINALDKNINTCDKSREGTKSKLKEELPFSCEQELNKLVDSPRRDLHIIGIYWKYKNFKFENRKQFEVSLKRELKPVQNLIPYQDDRIFEVIDYLDEKNFKWTLETVFKYINEDLDELKAKEKYK